MEKSRYFLAIIPSQQVANEIYAFKELVSEKFASKAALRSPAHITLHMPFLWNESKEHKLINKLVYASSFEKFEIKYSGFDCFPPKTIYVKNEFSEELISFQSHLAQTMKRELNLFNATHNRGFHPHTTIAFRDLKKNQFQEAWSYFRDLEYEASFEVNSFWLLKHDGKKWNAHHEFPFTDN